MPTTDNEPNINANIIHNTEMECSVLSAIMSQTQSFDEVKDILIEDCFFDESNRDIYNAIVTITSEGRIPDLLSVSSTLAKQGSKVGSRTLTAMCFSNPANTDTYTHCQILKDYALRRKLWRIGYNLMLQSNAESYPVNTIHNEAKEAIDNLYDTERKSLTNLDDTYTELQKHIIENMDMPDGSIRGTRTGFEEIDSKGGFCGGDLVVIGAETSQGKTSFATAVAVNAITSGDSVAFYSMEMTSMQLAARIASMQSGISSSRILNDRLSPEELYRIDDAMRKVDKSRMFFDESSTSSLDTLLMSIRSMKAKHDIKGAVVDYLQLIDNKDKNTTVEQATAVSARKMKNLAKELDIWVIAISQLSRNPQNPVPNKSRLRNSGQIEEAADTIILIYRPEGTKHTYPEPFEGIPITGTAMVMIEKGRNIGTGRFVCGFNGENTLFYPLDAAKINSLKTGVQTLGNYNPNNPAEDLYPF